MTSRAPVIVGIVIGLLIGALVYIGFGLYTWTAIHSGWSQSAIERYFLAAHIVPLVAGVTGGVLAGRAAYQRRQNR